MSKKSHAGYRKYRQQIVICTALLAVALGGYVYFSQLVTLALSGSAAVFTSLQQLGVPLSVTPAHIQTPTAVKAIYMSQCVVNQPKLRDKLVRFIESTELNAVVIDVRDYTGRLSFAVDTPALAGAVSPTCQTSDMKSFIDSLHAKHIYVIGRITVFQNPYYVSQHPEQAVQKKGGGVWLDDRGLAYVDVRAKPYWDTVVSLGLVSYKVGFDELNFDYVRYPSDGPMQEAVYTYSAGVSKSAALEEFFAYLHTALQPAQGGVQGRPVLSADLFGFTTTNKDDLGIGQILEKTLPYFDYVDPMIYPSHYPSGFLGFKDVNQHGYDIVKFSLDTAIARTEATSTALAAATQKATSTPQFYKIPAYSRLKIRPWLQSFDYPVVYTPTMVNDQLLALRDAGVESYLFWDANNQYTALREVLPELSGATSIHN